MKLIGKIIALVIVLCSLLFAGTCYFQNCREKPTVQLPKAEYRITVKVTGNVYFSNDVKVFGQGDKQIIYMKGYWENVKGKYVYKDITLGLDETFFGEIEVKKQ